MKKKEQRNAGKKKRLKRKGNFTKYIQLESFKQNFASGCRIASAGAGFHTNNSPSSLTHMKQHEVMCCLISDLPTHIVNFLWTWKALSVLCQGPFVLVRQRQRFWPIMWQRTVWQASCHWKILWENALLAWGDLSWTERKVGFYSSASSSGKKKKKTTRK